MISPWLAAHPKEALKLYIASLVLIMTSVVVGTLTETMSFIVATIFILMAIPCMLVAIVGSIWEQKLFERLTRRCARLEDTKHKITLGDRGVNGIAFYRFTPGIREWCSANLTGRYGILPQPEHHDRRVIWFSNPHDAMHFKLRWL